MSAESNMLAIATGYLRRQIAKRLSEMAERGEGIELDPDASAVIRLRDHCQRETDRISASRVCDVDSQGCDAL